MKRIIVILISGAVLLGLTMLLKSCSDSSLLKVSTEKVQRRNITETVSANGKIQPVIDVKISPDVSGEIVDLPVKEGMHVKKGDLLLTIKPDIYESTLERSTAALNASKANLANSKATLMRLQAQFVNADSSFARNKKLYAQNVISASDYDAAKASYEAAKADVSAAEQSVKAADFNVKSAEASVSEAQDNLNKTRIYAPIDGIVSGLVVEKGERVVGTSQMAGTEMMTVADLNNMEADVDVNENDIVRVHLGDTALISVDAFLDRKFKGIVTEIANAANTTGIGTDQVTNFTVKIHILKSSYSDLLTKDNPNVSPFRPGMSTTVDIETKSVKNALSVPIEAVTTREKKDTTKAKARKKKWGRSKKVEVTNNQETNKQETKVPTKVQEYIFLYDQGKAKQVHVTTGVEDNTYIEIKSGLKEGDEVISGPYSAVSKFLKDGSEVEKVDKSELFSSVGK